VAIDLKQLSAHLKLSPTTVSRALNGYTDVSEATRQRVAQAAKEFGYQPNLTARRLAMGRTDAIGMVYPLDAGDLGDPRFLEVVEGLSDALDQAGLDLLLVSARERSEMRTYERLVSGRRVDGLIVARTRVADPRIDYLLGAGALFVAYGRTGKDQNFPWFDFDNQAGSGLAVRELVALGHRQIAYVHAPLVLNFAHQRHAGFVHAMQAARLSMPPDLMVAAGMNRRNGYSAAQRLLALQNRPTAVVVDNNLCGVGVMRGLLDAGVVIGKEISVVVYDGVPPDTLLLGQQVAAVDQPTPQESGRVLGAMILSLVEGKPLEQRQVLRQPRFIGGNSIGPPRG
jgi:LacI family transcriptional regulator